MIASARMFSFRAAHTMSNFRCSACCAMCALLPCSRLVMLLTCTGDSSCDNASVSSSHCMGGRLNRLHSIALHRPNTQPRRSSSGQVTLECWQGHQRQEPVRTDCASQFAASGCGCTRSPPRSHAETTQQAKDSFPRCNSQLTTATQHHTLIDLHTLHLASERTSTPTHACDSQHPCVAVQIAVTHLPFEANPFTGKPFFNEVAFNHIPSRTLLTADFFWNYPAQGTSTRTRIWKAGMDKLFAPFYFNLMIKDRGTPAPSACMHSAGAHACTRRRTCMPSGPVPVRVGRCW